jgi:hypothetical protein
MIMHNQPFRALERILEYALRTAVLLLALAAFAPPAHAQFHDSTLLKGDGSTQKYIMEMSGSVLNERFNRVTMSLQLSGAPAGSMQPYMVIVTGFPDPQGRNTFFWNSEYSSMKINAPTITCTIKPGAMSAQDIHFSYRSPALLRKPQITHKDNEDNRPWLKTSVPAQVGELKLNISSATVSGTVWLQGYDTVEKSYVRYSATFTGKRADHIDQKTQRKHQ